MLELDVSRQRARRVIEENPDGSRASAEATERFFGFGVRRMELLKILDKRDADERLEEISYESQKIAIEGEMARLRSDQDMEDKHILARDGFIGPTSTLSCKDSRLLSKTFKCSLFAVELLGLKKITEGVAFPCGGRTF